LSWQSKADIGARSPDVCFAPESGHWLAHPYQWPFGCFR
jgi:hypothetical protein